MNAIELKGIEKTYIMGVVRVPALRGVDLEIHSGEFVAIMGASGSGKSTLMNILGCLDYPTGGTYTLDGTRVDRMNRRQLADIRNRRIGFVFQGFNLLARTSALENVELPLLYFRGDERLPAREMARKALERVGLGDRLDHEPTQLSGGQQQRVAIARALVNRPALVLADEPTGNLDTTTSNDVMKLFQELNDDGVTIVLVTHEPDIARFAKRIVELRDGQKIRDVLVDDRIQAGNGKSAFSTSREAQS
ncbi:MAG TPA: ABC transporter ATP-binding protein [Candidatus Aminicenantes bacterium]|nr:ABC transporter ATP-binding protein [Candidatus Aminicenantes bacterium]